MQDPKTRSHQATKYTPPELNAYQEFTQKDFNNVTKLIGYKVSTEDKSGLVPNGFAIWLAWEMIPGRYDLVVQFTNSIVNIIHPSDHT